MIKTSNIIAVAQETIQPDDGDLLALDYYLRLYTGPEGETLYGIRLDMRYPGGDLIEREETEGLSSCMEDITILAEAFARGAVVPYVLHEMVEDSFCPIEKKLSVF